MEVRVPNYTDGKGEKQIGEYLGNCIRNVGTVDSWYETRLHATEEEKK